MHGSKKVSVAICLMLNLRLTGLFPFLITKPHITVLTYFVTVCTVTGYE